MKKASDSTSENGEDTALEELEHKDGKEYIEPEVDDSDNIDPAVKSSDSAIVNEVAAEADSDACLPQLTREQINLSWFSLSKVQTIVQPVLSFTDQLLDTQPRKMHL